MKTNFVLIMCDQQLREHLGSCGSRYGVTPNLDRRRDPLRGECWVKRHWRNGSTVNFTIA